MTEHVEMGTATIGTRLVSMAAEKIGRQPSDGTSGEVDLALDSRQDLTADLVDVDEGARHLQTVASGLALARR
jgi:hypothetical protein